MISSPSARLARTALAAAVLCSAAAAWGTGASGLEVGHVSLLIGQARVIHKDGRSEPLRRGAPIVVGDRVETAANGHVHLRFIDNAAISVRPESVLEVQAYRYDAERPAVNEVRLNVEQGTSRSISGQATAADKSRFRLNTPIAAIGVRGTDFVVQASDLGVRATVAEGAIVVSALGANCSASTLGPCAGAQASVLSADMGRLMVEVLRGEQVARLVPAAGHALGAATASAEERMAAQRAADSATRSAGIAAAEVVNTNDRAAAQMLTIAAAGAPDLDSAADPRSQLAWGRYDLRANAYDAISVPAVIAARDREVAVGNSEFTLFRPADPNGGNVLASSETDVNFRLGRGQATFQQGARTEAASIDGGTLTLDFARRTFATGLSLSSASGVQAELRVAGEVQANGVFVVRDNNPLQYVAGAVSFDGKEAGYLFERGAAGGLFRGKTLWGR